jgi:hypothetical protein
MPVISGTMPGSTTDYEFFGVGGTLDDFGSITNGPDTLTYGYGPGSGLTTEYSPTATNTNTGILYENVYATPYLVSVTLGSSPTFNYSDFDVYFMFGTAPNSVYVQDGTVGLSLYSTGADPATATALASGSVTVTDTNSDPSANQASFQEFEITGAAANEVLAFDATPAAGYPQNYIAGASFVSNRGSPLGPEMEVSADTRSFLSDYFWLPKLVRALFAFTGLMIPICLQATRWVRVQLPVIA